MPTYSEEKIKELIAMIRRILVSKPDASSRQIEKVMRANGIAIDHHYILKLLKKIYNERAYRYNHLAASEVVAKFEDLIHDMNNELYKIKTDSQLDFAKIAAVNSIVKNSKLIIDLQFDNGMLERHLGKITVENLNVSEVLKILKEAKDVGTTKQITEGDSGDNRNSTK